MCTIGPKTVEDLFGRDDPLGEVIRIKNINFRIIGVQKTKGDQGWANPDAIIHVPYTVAMQELFGLDNVPEFFLQIKQGADMDAVKEHIRQVLRRLHHLQSDQEDDFHIRDQAGWQQRVMDTSQTFTILLGGIASISLLVGGIGIMNIMLVTVTERTREIGVRKAIGAKERTILLQFLFEALIISGLGGLIGVAPGGRRSDSAGAIHRVRHAGRISQRRAGAGILGVCGRVLRVLPGPASRFAGSGGGAAV